MVKNLPDYPFEILPRGVIHGRGARAQSRDDDEVARRWLRLCPPKSPLDATAGECSTHFQTCLNTLLANPEQVAVYRERLHSLSWLMRFLNESIARKANREDGVKGRFCRRLPCRLPFWPREVGALLGGKVTSGDRLYRNRSNNLFA